MEKPSRAIGLKSEKDARGDEPAKEKPPRENEPGGINPQIRTKKCVRSPREDEPGENSFGKVWDRTPENGNFGLTEPMKVKGIFGTVTLKKVLVLGILWQETAAAWRTTVLSPLVVTLNMLLKLLQPPLANTHHCPTGCPKVPAVRLAAMAPKMSKPAPPLPPQTTGEAAAVPAAAAVRRKAPPMMLQCAAALQGTSTAASSDGSRARQDPYIGAMPKFPPARLAAEKAMKKAGGTQLDQMPQQGPWLDERFGAPSRSGKKGWMVRNQM